MTETHQENPDGESSISLASSENVKRAKISAYDEFHEPYKQERQPTVT